MCEVIHQCAERIAAVFIVAELVEGGAGRRQQNHRRRRAGFLCVARGGSSGILECPTDLEWHIFQCARENLRCLADQIGFADTWEERHKTLDAAFLGAATRNQKCQKSN